MQTTATKESETPTDATAAREAQALSVRMWLACLATQELLCHYLGLRLGLYEVLRDSGAATPAELASRAKIAPRYAREWLEQQAVCGVLKVESPHEDDELRRYALPAGHAEVLTLSESPLSRAASILPVS